MPSLPARIAARYLRAATVPFDPSRALQLKKDLETWAENVDRIDTEQKYNRLEQAIKSWVEPRRRENQALGKYLHDTSVQFPNPERQMDIWRKKITPLFDATTAVYLPPWEYWSTDAYRRQDWARKLRDIASHLPEVAKFLDNLRKQKKIVPTITTVEEQRINVEGFPIVTVGFDPGDPAHQEAFDVIRVGLREYRTKAKVVPILLSKPVSIFLRFDVTASLEGTMGSGGDNQTTVYPFNVAHKGPRQIVQLLAHESGHSLWSTFLSSKDHDFWRIAINGDMADLDLRDFLRQWPPGKSLYAWMKSVQDSDPVLYLQIEALGMTPSNPNVRQIWKYWEKMDDREGIEAYLANGGNPVIRMPKTPITGYATTNPQEAFCEALGNLVAFGPRTLDPTVLGWLKAILPGIRTAHLPITEKFIL